MKKGKENRRSIILFSGGKDPVTVEKTVPAGPDGKRSESSKSLRIMKCLAITGAVIGAAAIVMKPGKAY